MTYCTVYGTQEMQNMGKLLQALSSPVTIRMLKILYERPLLYGELAHKFSNMKNSTFAYYIRQNTRLGSIKKDQRTQLYHLTWFGEKLTELLDSIEQLANISIEKIDNTKVSFDLDLQRNRDWLEPLLKSEIRRVVQELR